MAISTITGIGSDRQNAPEGTQAIAVGAVGKFEAYNARSGQGFFPPKRGED